MLASGEWIEQQNAIYDQSFWDNYNIILPGAEFLTMAKNIVASNRANDFKTEIANQLRKYPKDKGARIDSVLSFYNRKNLFNGNALIEHKGALIFQKSYNNVLTQNQLQTRFRIGSTSKTFTSMLILLLEEEGKLKVTDSIGKHLPDYVHPQLTIEQLLTHQSGIPNYLENNEYLEKIFSRPYLLDEVIADFCSDSLEFAPGSRFNYSNSGFVLLSKIIEQVEGKSFGQVLKEKVFNKLAMEQSYFGTPKDSNKLAVGYLYGQAEPAYAVQNISGAGGVTSTTGDLLKWSRALDTNLLLPPRAKMEEMWSPRASYKDWEATYGYGWMIDEYMFTASKRHQIYYHPGTELGFYSMFLKQPDEGITIILLSNTGDFPRFEITDLILEELN